MESSDLFNGLTHLSLEEQILVSRFGRGSTVIAPHSTVHKAFESIVDSHSSAIAAVFGDEQITYGDLDAAANRLANYLIETGLKPKQRVCVVVQRSLEMLVGIFAVLKAGCQYVPVDGTVSSDLALRHILKDTGSRFVLCLPKLEAKVRQCSEVEDVVIVLLGQGVEDFSSKERPQIPVSSQDGIYAIYTSGMPVTLYYEPLLI